MKKALKDESITHADIGRKSEPIRVEWGGTLKGKNKKSISGSWRRLG